MAESFLIKSVSGGGSLEFLGPGVIGGEYGAFGYRVRLTDANLSAAAEVYYDLGDPTGLIRDMAERWRGWDGELVWGSLEGELTLRCTQDRAGHVSIGVELTSVPYTCGWSIRATIMAEAGQLEDIARRAEAFFGGLGSRAGDA